MSNLTTATNFLSFQQSLDELLALKFAVGTIAKLSTQPGSCERELATNAARGIDQRINYLHDSLVHARERLTK